ncbi:MAG: hypothetical protein DME51_09690 [Verrucomicrobia bacterium]|nr:MAG: hypothetical protein DME51_09690 [Verrucomicrobiota bacterium]
MTSQSAEHFRLTVLNPGGRDPEQSFHGVPAPAEGAHPPINFHAFAACTLGAFHFNPRRAIAEDLPVLLLLRSDFRASERALYDLKKQGRIVAVSLKETGLHQIAQQLCDRAKLLRFMKIVAQADGCIATTPEAAEIYQRVRSKCDPATVLFAPTPYPITGEPVTVVNLDGYKGRRLLDELRFPKGKLRLIEKWKSYPDYLRDVAQHKIVLQLDRSHVPGQVAGDALLCRVACVGGDGAIERIAFPKTCGEGRSITEIASTALDLLKNLHLRAAIVAESQARALERLSFQTMRSQLANFFASLKQS